MNAVRRAQKVAEKAAAAAAKPHEAEKRKRRMAEAAEEESSDKENVSPNVSAVVRAATRPTRYVCTDTQQGERVVLRMRKSE